MTGLDWKVLLVSLVVVLGSLVLWLWLLSRSAVKCLP